MRDLVRSPGAAYWIGVAGGLAYAAALGFFAQREALVHLTDFSGYWAGGRALLAGADPYDPATWRATTELLRTQPPDTSVYGYFPWVAVAMVPLALLPLEAAAWLWCIASIVVASAGVAMLLRARPCPPAAQLAVGFALFGSQPAGTALVVGQWSPMLTGALAFAVAALGRGQLGRAVPALLLSLAKPHLYLLTIPVIALRQRRLTVPLAAAGIAIALVATALMPNWLDAWTRYVPGSRITDPPRAAVVASLAWELLGSAGPPIAGAVIVALAAVVAWRFGLAGDAALAAWLALSILAAPYAWSYDWLLLIVPLVLGIAALGRDRPRRATALALTGNALLTVAAAAFYAVAVTRGRESLSGVVPLALTLALIVALWPIARSGSERGRVSAGPGRPSRTGSSTRRRPDAVAGGTR